METSEIMQQNTVLEIQQKLQKALLTMDQTPSSIIQLQDRLEEIIQDIAGMITTSYLEDDVLLKLFDIFDFCTNYLERIRLSLIEGAQMLKDENCRISA
jgi:hypothetical protein